MEQFPNNNNPEENTNQKSTGADILANMPSFEEMRRQNSVPEGVRDEQDYREYQAEQLARSAEQDKADSEFIEHSNRYIAEIDKIEDPQERYLMVAFLGHLAGRQANELERAKRINAHGMALKYLISQDYKNESFDDFAEKQRKSIIADDDEVRLYVDGGKFDQEFEQKISKKYGGFEDVSPDAIRYYETNAKAQIVNDAKQENEIQTSLNKRLSKHGLREFFYESDSTSITISELGEDRGVIISLADEILSEYENEDYLENGDFEAESQKRNELAALREYYQYGQSLDKQLSSCHKRLKHNYEEGRDISRIISEITAIEEVKNRFELRRDSYESFKRDLVKGKQILNSFKNNSEA